MQIVQKNIRALFRLVRLLLTTSGIYAIWLAGNFFVENPLRWRQEISSKLAAAIIKIANVKIEVRGKPPPAPFFLVSNHLGYLDVAAYRAVVECVFIAKSEVAGWFALGKIISAMGTVFINRKSRRDILRAVEEIVEKLRAGESLIIFPEGTSSNGAKVLPFKSSFLEFAARANLPVFYASISYRTPDKTVKPSESICWWGDADFIPHLWQLFQIKTLTAIITFGQEAINCRDRKKLAEQLQVKVSESFIKVL